MSKVNLAKEPYTVTSTVPETEYYKFEDDRTKVGKTSYCTSEFLDDNGKGDDNSATACTEKPEENKDEQFTYEELTALCRKQEEYIKGLEEKLKEPTEKNTLKEEERKDYDDLLFQYRNSMNRIRDLEEIVNSLLYALRKTNVERLVNEDEYRHYQEMYAQEHKRANQLFDIVEKSNINEYEKK